MAARLKASALGERIQLLHLDSADYRQEAFMNALVEVSQAWAPDWLYPFDADEFLLVSAGLPRFLGSLPDQIDAVHYELENWISTPEFDESDLDEVYATERHLLYVACTRAREHLLVTAVEPQSEFLDDLIGAGRPR